MTVQLLKLFVVISMILPFWNIVHGQTEKANFRIGDNIISLRKIVDLKLSEKERKLGPGIRTNNANEYALSSVKGGVKVWSINTGDHRLCRGEANSTYNHIALSKDGEYLAGYRAKKIFVWETKTCRVVTTLTVDKDLNHYGLAISSNGKYLFYAHDASRFLRKREKVILWDIERGKEIADMQPERLPIYRSGYDPLFDRDALRPTTADFSPDSKILAVQYSYRIYLWDTETGKAIQRLVDSSLDDEMSQGGIYNIKFSNDGSLLLSNAADGTVKIWDVGRKQLSKTFRIGERVHGRTTLSNDNNYMATSIIRGEVSVWDVTTGQMLWKGARKNYSPSFSDPDVGLVSVESGDIYDVESGARLEGINGEFLEDGKLLKKDKDGNRSTWIVKRK